MKDLFGILGMQYLKYMSIVTMRNPAKITKIGLSEIFPEIDLEFVTSSDFYNYQLVLACAQKESDIVYGAFFDLWCIKDDTVIPVIKKGDFFPESEKSDLLSFLAIQRIFGPDVEKEVLICKSNNHKEITTATELWISQIRS